MGVGRDVLRGVGVLEGVQQDPAHGAGPGGGEGVLGWWWWGVKRGERRFCGEGLGEFGGMDIAENTKPTLPAKTRLWVLIGGCLGLKGVWGGVVQEAAGGLKTGLAFRAGLKRGVAGLFERGWGGRLGRVGRVGWGGEGFGERVV